MWQKEGFITEKINIAASMKKLGAYIDLVPKQFSLLSSEEILKIPAPGKWSKQQILGHLIDSALNNLKRFTDIQHAVEPFIVPSYKQAELVLANNYQHLPLEPLLELWKALNTQIINVVKNVPSEKFEFPVDPQYDNGEMRTFEWIICDYVAHLEHHLHQLFPTIDLH